MASIEQQLLQGLADFNAGKLDAAEQAYNAVLEEDPVNADALHLKAHLELRKNNRDAALVAVDAAIAANDGISDFHNSRGAILATLGRFDEALSAYDHALRLKPDSGDILYNAGLLYLKLGDKARAERHFRLAAAADEAHAGALLNLGALLREMGQEEEAETFLRQALEIRPDYPEALNNLAIVLHRRDVFDEAKELYARAIKLMPQRADFIRNLGVLYKDMGYIAEAHQCFTKAMTIDPHHLEARRGLLVLMSAVPGVSVSDLGDIHKAFGEWAEHEHQQHAPRAETDRDPNRKLRIGYVSSDLRIHPVARNIEPLLQHYDRDAFTVHCFAEIAAPDPMTHRLMPMVDYWHDTVGRTDEQVSTMIRDAGIDILIFLAGHFDGNRLPLAVQQAAPVQISFHDIATSGLQAMDYLIADPVLYRRGSEEPFTERVLRLPSFYLHEPIPDAPPVVPPPLKVTGTATLGVFNNPFKINDAVLTLWAGLAEYLPNTRFLFKYKDAYSSETLRARILKPFEQKGIAADRIDFATGRDALFNHMDRLNTVDIALDPFPFSGSTTTFECLWMGVPVVTWPQDSMVSRWTMSMLHRIGLDELVAKDGEDYVRIVESLIADPERLAGMRRSTRGNLAASAMCDGALRTRQLERLYRAVWRKHCQEEG